VQIDTVDVHWLFAPDGEWGKKYHKCYAPPADKRFKPVAQVDTLERSSCAAVVK